MKKDCISEACIYNDTLRKGLCIGSSTNTRSYHKDVIRMCWVGRKPEAGKECDVNIEAQCTPEEATMIGVALIRASLVGDALLRNMEGAEREKSKSK